MITVLKQYRGEQKYLGKYVNTYITIHSDETLLDGRKLACYSSSHASLDYALRIGRATKTITTLSMAEQNTYELVSIPNMLSSNRSACGKSDSRVNLTTAANGNHSELNQRKPQSTGKVCAMMLVALIAALAILVLAGIVALILFNPQTTESNSEIETLRQQMESLRMTVTQIQQTNVSSFQGTAREEISRQAIQEMLDISIQALHLQMNNSIQVLQLQINNSNEELILKLQLVDQNAENLQAIVDEIKANVSTKVADLKYQINSSSARVQLRFEELTEKVDMSATNNQAFQLEVHELRSTINTTEIELNKKLINTTDSLFEKLKLQVAKIESQANVTHNWLNNQITSVTTILNEVVSQRLNEIESQVNLTHNKIEQIYFEVPSVLKNATTPLAMSINQLADWTNNSLETLKSQVHQYTNDIHDLELRFNNSQYDNNNQQNKTGSKLHKHHRHFYTTCYIVCFNTPHVILLCMYAFRCTNL